MRRTRKTLELLAAERPPELDVVDQARRHRDLAAILATPRHGRDGEAGHRSWRRDQARLLPRRHHARLRAGLATALVAAVTVAVAVAPHARPDRGDRVSRDGAVGVTTPEPKAAAQGNQFLLASAERILAVPATPEGPYWYTRTRNLVVTTADAFSRHPRRLHFLVRIESTSESWMPMHRGTGHLVGPTDLPSIKISFPSAKDRAAWRAAGSPRIDYPPAGVGRVQDLPGTRVEIAMANGKALTADDLGRLPTDPVALEVRIRSLLRQAGAGLPVVRFRDGQGHVGTKVVPRRGQQPNVTDRDVFDLLASLLDAPVSHQLQAAAYQVLARLPGVHEEGPTVDITGRRGIAITWDKPGDEGSDGAIVNNRMIINPTTGELLGNQQVIVRPAPSRGSDRVDPTHSAPAGTIITAQAYLARHWTEGPGPGGWPTNPPGVIAPRG
jgi:hypothetical protein